MSFILEALKKSENKRRKKSGLNPRTIHEPVQRNRTGSRVWLWGLLILLLVNAALLLWFFGFRPPGLPSKPAATLSVDSTPVAVEPIKVVSPKPLPSVSSTQESHATTSATAQKRPAVNKVFPVPRSEKKVYSFGQLPVAIQKQIPPLQMSLHAYNRNDAGASMVQLNDRIMREGDKVTDSLLLEKITSVGVVLRYDGYRFLLPRHGN